MNDLVSHIYVDIFILSYVSYNEYSNKSLMHWYKCKCLIYSSIVSKNIKIWQAKKSELSGKGFAQLALKRDKKSSFELTRLSLVDNSSSLINQENKNTYWRAQQNRPK